MTRLEGAAIEYLKALESDEPIDGGSSVEKFVEEAKDKLASIAIMWAQQYVIDNSDKVAKLYKPCVDHSCGGCDDCYDYLEDVACGIDHDKHCTGKKE